MKGNTLSKLRLRTKKNRFFDLKAIVYGMKGNCLN